MGEATPDRSRAAVERAVREEWGYILATLVKQVRDLELAEDVLQDAAVAALESWPRDGVPDRPRAWLLQAARNRAIDRFRRDARLRVKLPSIEAWLERGEAVTDGAAGEETTVDERLSLIFTCCHPALAERSRVALTLRTLGGLTTGEIARAFVVPETTLAQRLVRAKRKIKAANIPYRVPPPELWPERLDSVLEVIYLIFNEGYQATSGGRLARLDLCDEAIRLGTIVAELAPREPEAAGLLALMLLHDSRRSARTDASENFVALEQQDRRLWDRDRVRAGERLLEAALQLRRPGPYQVQAAISAVHAHADSHAATDWHEIVRLYRRLYELHPSWVVRLNEAVALSYAAGAEAGLARLEQLAELECAETLESYQPFHAAHADLLRRAGRAEEAAAAYRRALERTRNVAERRFLEQRLAELS